MFSSQPGKLGAVGRKTVVQRAIAVLRRYGQDAHIYLPGVGMLNGLTAANYLDSAGTTVGTVDQPVGLVLDAAGGLGVELVTPALWGGLASGVVINTTTNVFTLTAASSTLLAANNFLIAGKIYQVTFVVQSISSGSVSLTMEGGTRKTPVASTPGIYTAQLQATNSGNLFLYLESSPVTGVITNISVREVTGIHASQPTTASKPILRRGAVNLLTYSGDFSNAAWVLISGASKTTNTVTFGALSASALEANQIVSGGTASKTFTVAALVSCASGTVPFRLKNTHGGVTDNFSVELTATTTPQIFVFTVTNGVGAGSGAQNFGLENSAVSPGANTLISGGCALFQGTYTAQQIQALGGIPLTTTAPASTALGPQYWQFDGSNDSLSLGGPLFQMADDHCVVAGANPSVGAGYKIIQCVGGYGATDQCVGLLSFDPSNKPYANWRDDANTGGFIASSSSFNQSVVATAVKVGNSKRLRVNGVQHGATNNAVFGATTITTNALIGTTSLGNPWFIGSIYPVIAIKGTVTDPDLLLLEKFVANLSGVTL